MMRRIGLWKSLRGISGLSWAISRKSRACCRLARTRRSWAWLLRSIEKPTLALTADYGWKRYSEYETARQHARTLGVDQQRVMIRLTDHQDAFCRINSAGQNGPSCHSQTPSLQSLANSAQEQGISALVTGDHADSLFLGFDYQFRGLPAEQTAYSRAIARLSLNEKVEHVCTRPSLAPADAEFLSFLGYNPLHCIQWQEDLYQSDRNLVSRWATRLPLHTIQQLNGQVWAGISWQNIFLPVTEIFRGGVEFISPFYDIELVRFALSLPAEYKFRNGETKALLRELLYKVAGIRVKKRASPNPSRLWRTIPAVRERKLLIPRLRPFYDHLFIRNLMNKGVLWRELDKMAALGIWLAGRTTRLEHI